MYKDCYVELTLTIDDTEVFVNKKLIFLGKLLQLKATLHCNQANSFRRKSIIMEKMWKDLPYKLSKKDVRFHFSEKAMPKKYKPITYRV